jgi:hypothetical protein
MPAQNSSSVCLHAVHFVVELSSSPSASITARSTALHANMSLCAYTAITQVKHGLEKRGSLSDVKALGYILDGNSTQVRSCSTYCCTQTRAREYYNSVTATMLLFLLVLLSISR